MRLITGRCRCAIWIVAIAMLASLIRFSPAADEIQTFPLQLQRVNDASSQFGENSANQIASEILKLRQEIGSAWRMECELAGAECGTSDDQIVRTALLAQAHHSPPTQADSSLLESDQREALREAAHQLDLTAHTLECREIYDQADELRAAATRFRLLARSKMPPVGQPWKPVKDKRAD